MTTRAFLLASFLAAALSAQRELVPAVPRTITVYDVRDLVGAEDQGAQAQTAEAQDLARSRLETLAGFLRTFLQPGLARGEEVTVAGQGHLVLVARAEQHAFVKRFLDAQREDRNLQVMIEARFLVVPDKLFQTEVRPLLRRPESAPEEQDAAAGQSVVLDASAESEAFVRRLSEAEGVNLLLAPRVLSRRLDHTEMFAGDQVSYIRDFKVERRGDSVIADPVVDIVRDGQRLECTAARLSPDQLGLDVTVERHDLMRPIPTFTTSLGVGQPVTIQLPRVQVARLSASVIVPRDAQVLMVLPATVEDRRTLVVLRATPKLVK